MRISCILKDRNFTTVLFLRHTGAEPPQEVRKLAYVSEMGIQTQFSIESIARKPLKKYGLNLSYWNTPTTIYQNLENDIFILIGRNMSLKSMTKLTLFMSPTHK